MLYVVVLYHVFVTTTRSLIDCSADDPLDGRRGVRNCQGGYRNCRSRYIPVSPSSRL